jgi:hypothetical protein
MEPAAPQVAFDQGFGFGFGDLDGHGAPPVSKGSSFYPTAKGGAGTHHIKGDFTLSVRLSNRQERSELT